MNLVWCLHCLKGFLIKESLVPPIARSRVAPPKREGENLPSFVFIRLCQPITSILWINSTFGWMDQFNIRVDHVYIFESSSLSNGKLHTILAKKPQRNEKFQVKRHFAVVNCISLPFLAFRRGREPFRCGFRHIRLRFLHFAVVYGTSAFVSCIPLRFTAHPPWSLAFRSVIP